MRILASISPAAAKAQHDPQLPWFLAGVTPFMVRQSQTAGRSSLSAGKTRRCSWNVRSQSGGGT